MPITYTEEPNGGTMFYQPGKQPLLLFGDAAQKLKERSVPMSPQQERERVGAVLTGGPSVDQITAGLDRTTEAGGMTTDSRTRQMQADANLRAMQMGKTAEQMDRQRTVELGQSVGRLRQRVDEGRGDLSQYSQKEPDLDRVREEMKNAGALTPDEMSGTNAADEQTLRDRIAELEQRLAQLEGK